MSAEQIVLNEPNAIDDDIVKAFCILVKIVGFIWCMKMLVQLDQRCQDNLEESVQRWTLLSLGYFKSYIALCVLLTKLYAL